MVHRCLLYTTVGLFCIIHSNLPIASAPGPLAADADAVQGQPSQTVSLLKAIHRPSILLMAGLGVMICPLLLFPPSRDFGIGVHSPDRRGGVTRQDTDTYVTLVG